MVVRGFKEAFQTHPATDVGTLWNVMYILVPPDLEQSLFCLILSGLRYFSLSFRILGVANVVLSLWSKVASASGNSTKFHYFIFLFFFSRCWAEFLRWGKQEDPGIGGESQHTKVPARIQTRLCDTCLGQVRPKTPGEVYNSDRANKALLHLK